MADVVYVFLSSPRSFRVLCILLFIFLSNAQTVVFQPPYVITTGPTVSALLLGHAPEISLNLRTVTPSRTTGRIDPPSCLPGVTQWTLTTEQAGKTALQVQLQLNRNLRLCGDNETDCCIKPLCVLETIQVSACRGNTSLASLLIQAEIYALLHPANYGFDNRTIIPNQVYQPLGSCPCDLTSRTCDVQCCCDKDCSPEDLKLFQSHCLPGPFGGQVAPPPDYHCSVQSSENSPDWFPFLCVTSPPENNPYLGLFYQGDKIIPKPGPSFGSPSLSAPVPANTYMEGSPILTLNDMYFTVPQKINGRCVDNAPVAFLKNFDVQCVTMLRSCPTGFPLKTVSTDLKTTISGGDRDDVTVDVRDEVATDLSQFISSTGVHGSPGQVCENVTLALDYKFYWAGNGITQVTLTRTVGTVTLNDDVTIITRYSAVFLNGEFMGETNSGNPGYQVGKPVIGGIVDSSVENNTDSLQRTSINLWRPVNNGLCPTADKKPILFGENSTSGCLLPVTWQNLIHCRDLRDTVTSLQKSLVEATYVAKNGRPDALMMTDWVNISFEGLKSIVPMEDTNSTCSDIPSHQHIHVLSLVTGVVDGIPQKSIRSVQISHSMSTWRLGCGGEDVSLCVLPTETKLFPITSSVTFTDILITGPPKTRFQINFTEYDCSRNDICWPELAFPMTIFYTGEPYSQSLAKGLILVFFFIAASVLGTPWRQIRQVWNSL